MPSAPDPSASGPLAPDPVADDATPARPAASDPRAPGSPLGGDLAPSTIGERERGGPRAGEDERIGERDLGQWRTGAGRSLERAALAVGRRLAPLVRWSLGHVAFVVTVLVGGLATLLLLRGAAEIYEGVTEGADLAALDQPVLDWAVAQRTPTLDSWVTGFTDVGGVIGMPVLATVLVVTLAIWWRRWTPVVLMVVAATGSVAMTVLGKDLVGRARPPLALAVPPYETSPSFPSGHTLNATVVLGIVAYLLLIRWRTRPLRWLSVVLASGFVVAMGLSRVFLGHHWLTDVVAGWLLGLAWVAVVVTGHRLMIALGRVDRLAPRRRADPSPDTEPDPTTPS